MITARNPGTGPITTVGPYHVITQLGGDRSPEDGGTATYLAEAGGRRFVVKALICSPEFGGTARGRFERETTIGGLIGHPAVAAVETAGTFAHGHYLAYPWTDGTVQLGELSADWHSNPAVREDRGSFVRRVLSYHAQVARGLQAMHDEGVLHRDVKPSNIVVSGDDALLVDFGLCSYMAAPREEAEGMCVGTLPFLAPEYRRSGIPAISADVFSLGASLYSCVLGVPPYSGMLSGERTRSERRGAFPRRHWSGIDGDLEAVLLRAVEPDLRQRYRTAGELASDLECLLAGKSVRAEPRKLRTSARLAVANHPKLAWLAGGFALTTLLTGAIALWTMRERDRVLEREVRYVASLALQDPSRIPAQLREQQAAMQASVDDLEDAPLRSPEFQGAAQMIGARRLEALGLRNEALGAALAAAETVASVVGPDHPFYLSANVGVANLLFSVGDFERAEERYAAALRTLETSTDPGAPLLQMACLQNQATLLLERGDPKGAIEGFRRVLDEGEGTQLVRARIRSILGEALLRVGMVDEAEVELVQAYDVLSSLEGPSSMMTLEVRRRRARVELSRGLVADALVSMLEVLELAEGRLGPAHVELAPHYALLARIYNDLGRYEEAAAFADQTYGLLLGAGERSFDRISATSEMVRALLRLGAADTALVAAEQLMGDAAWLTEGDPYRACVLSHNLGVAFREVGRATDAIPVLENAIEMAASLWRWGDPKSDLMSFNYALALADLGRHQEAISVLECCRANALARSEGDSWVCGQVMAAHGQLLIREEAPEQALPILEEALAVLSLHRPLSPEAYLCCEAVAAAHFKSLRFELARATLGAFVDQPELSDGLRTKGQEIIALMTSIEAELKAEGK